MIRTTLRAGILCAAVLFTVPVTSTTTFAQGSKVVTLLDGQIKTSDGSKAGGVQVAIFNGTNKVNGTKTTDEGKFSAVLPPNATYRITYTSNNFFYHEDTVVVPALEKYEKTPVNTTLKALKNPISFNLSKAVFLPGSKEISSESNVHFDEIAYALKHNSRLTVQFTVHPDRTPDPKKAKKDDTQTGLVAARASAITSFMLSRGVSTKQFEVTQSLAVPTEAKFSSTVTETVKKKQVTKTVMVPQYVEVQANVAG